VKKRFNRKKPKVRNTKKVIK